MISIVSSAFNSAIWLGFRLLLIQGTFSFVLRDAIQDQLRGGAGTGGKVGEEVIADAQERGLLTKPVLGRGPPEPIRPFLPKLLEGKRALVTGGNRGIGEAITVALVMAGAKVCVLAGNEE